MSNAIISKNWQTRYFRLDYQSKTLSYYTEKEKTNKKGTISLVAQSTVVHDNSKSQPNCFAVTGYSDHYTEKSMSTLIMSATTPQARNVWVECINRCIRGETMAETVVRNVKEDVVFIAEKVTEEVHYVAEEVAKAAEAVEEFVEEKIFGKEHVEHRYQEGEACACECVIA